jgi:hypothetical protein
MIHVMLITMNTFFLVIDMLTSYHRLSFLFFFFFSTHQDIDGLIAHYYWIGYPKTYLLMTSIAMQCMHPKFKTPDSQKKIKKFRTPGQTTHPILHTPYDRQHPKPSLLNTRHVGPHVSSPPTSCGRGRGPSHLLHRLFFLWIHLLHRLTGSAQTETAGTREQAGKLSDSGAGRSNLQVDAANGEPGQLLRWVRTSPGDRRRRACTCWSG